MKDAKIAFIGAGNLATALIAGLCANNIAPKNISASCPHQQALDSLQKHFGIHVSTDNKMALAVADVVILAVKPQVMQEVLIELGPSIAANKPLLISVAAGITTATLQQKTSSEVPIIRAMPNTAASVQSSATGLFASEIVSRTQRDLAEHVFRSVGLTVWLPEEQQLDIVTALAGSGVAYFFRMMEILSEAAIAMGLDQEVANLLTLETAQGAARLALASSESLTTLRERVTSPKGTTEAALNVLDQGNLKQLFTDALFAAKQRAQELSKEL